MSGPDTGTRDDLRHQGEVAPDLLARGIAEAALEKKGEELVLLDLRELTPMTDFFVIGTVSTDVHSRAVEEHLREMIRERFGVKPWHVEGGDASRTWVLLDYVDVVVHLFQPETRAYYDLERLWGDAPREAVADDPA
jgi:ribosome-associated protein